MPAGLAAFRGITQKCRAVLLKLGSRLLQHLGAWMGLVRILSEGFYTFKITTQGASIDPNSAAGL